MIDHPRPKCNICTYLNRLQIESSFAHEGAPLHSLHKPDLLSGRFFLEKNSHMSKKHRRRYGTP